ncbi:MAG: DNA mismatch repair endonuclease MutL, partial [Bacteroidetes bacterium]|nr:DNA mismatch repair endonuclease MutL [Bacteroidota bacterium]
MPDRLANKIAAGEVVQRPASVAKELLENAIDAGARSIELVLKDAGSTLVQVIDDGCGMSPSDAVQCFQRHATSKIQSVDDLERIRTLGFRGEALASIAAVAQVELKTRRVEDDVGYRVCVDGGEMTTSEPCAAPPGTSIAVRNLFYNVPARRNFLKTPATEFKHLTDTFQFIALAEPTVGFALEHKGHAVYDLAAVDRDDFFARTRRRIIDLLGADHEGQLVPVDDESSYLAARGFVGKPAFNRKTRGDQFLFVNGRYVKSRYLSHAVRAAYGELLPDGAFPFFALFLDLDPRRVDVNVHPTKAEVKFEDESGIYGFLRGAVRDALSRDQLTPAFSSSDDDASEQASPADRSAASGDAPQPAGPRPFQPRTTGTSSSHSARGASSRSGRDSERPSPPQKRSASASPGEISQALYGDQSADPSEAEAPVQPVSNDEPATDDASATDAATSHDEEAPPSRTTPWTLHDTYLITPTEDGMMLVDQQAAHTRVLYERALDQAQAGHAESQQLLFPETIDLSPSEMERFDAWKTDLQAMGFAVERLSGRTVAIRAVPAEASSGDAAPMLRDLLDEIEAGTHDASDRRKALAA